MLNNKFLHKLTVPIFVLSIPTFFFVSGIITLSDYGVSWDEPYHFRRGQAILHFFLTGKKTYEGMPKYPPLRGDSDNPVFRNAQAIFEAVQKNPLLSDPNFRRSYYQDDTWNGEYLIDMEGAYGHPPLPSILAALTNRVFYQNLNLVGDIEGYHMSGIVLSSLAVLSVSIFMWWRYGIFASLITGLAFTTYPLLVGERHFNIKDPAEMTFFTWTILSFYLAIIRKSPRWFALTIISFALALATKLNILFALFPMGVWFFYIFGKVYQFSPSKIPRSFFLLTFCAPFLVLGFFIAVFPTLWHNPILEIGKVVAFYREIGINYSQPETYYIFGKTVNTFPALWILFTTPLSTLIFFTLSVLNLKRSISRTDFAFPLLLFLWLFVSVGRVSLFGSASHGGVRIIMEFIPAISMLAGLGAYWLVQTQKNGRLFQLLCILSFLPIIFTLIRIHPHQNVYFNGLIGGLSGAKEKNFDAWGNSLGNAYYPGVLWINEHAPPNSRLALPVGGPSNIPRPNLRPDIALSPYYWSGPEHKGEYVIELTHNYPPSQWYSLRYLNQALTPVFAVKVDNVALAKVWKNDERYLKDEFKKAVNIPGKVIANKLNRTVEIELDKTYKVMKVELSQPTKNCQPVKTGYVITTVDGKDWIREQEDIVRDQVRQQALKTLEPTFEFYFVAREAKRIIFSVENENSCLVNATEVRVTVLEGK